MTIESFEQLEVWQKEHAVVLQVYKVTKGFPSEEKFGLVSQMARAAVAVPANIAEGFKRRGKPDNYRFYNIAEALIEELRYYFILCRDFGIKIQFSELNSFLSDVAKMLNVLIRSVRSYED